MIEKKGFFFFWALLLSVGFACTPNKPDTIKCITALDCGDGYTCEEGICVALPDETAPVDENPTDSEEDPPIDEIVTDDPDNEEADDTVIAPDEDEKEQDGTDVAPDEDQIEDADPIQDTDTVITDDAAVVVDDDTALPDVDAAEVDDAVIPDVDTAVPYCGDGNQDAGEECDLGTALNGNCSTCTAGCVIKAANTCGDGFTCGAEQCDDGNADQDDGCYQNCMTGTRPIGAQNPTPPVTAVVGWACDADNWAGAVTVLINFGFWNGSAYEYYTGTTLTANLPSSSDVQAACGGTDDHDFAYDATAMVAAMQADGKGGPYVVWVYGYDPVVGPAGSPNWWEYKPLQNHGQVIVCPPVTATFNYSGSIVNWTVPMTRTYTIEVWGAQGGAGSGSAGGLGARMKGDFALTAGTVLKILVGGQGGAGTNGGGGGGSFVTDSANSPYIIAGGGGGGYYDVYSAGSGNMAGTTGTSGMDGYNGNTGAIAGYGGAGTNGGGTSAEYTADGSGGGGLTGNGENGDPSTGGSSFVNGGAGGIGASIGGDFTGGSGGFGGGGGGDFSNWTGGGGGGGYGGGGGGAFYGCGGGGGSYNGGTNQSNATGVQAGNGQVTITY